MATGEASTWEAQFRKPFASPFFLYFMFSLLCTTLRWHWIEINHFSFFADSQLR